MCHKMVMQVGTYVSSKSGKSNIGPGGNKKISSMLKKVDKTETYRKSCGYLLDSEMEEYSKMFANAEELFNSIPKIRQRRELWTLKKDEIFDHLLKEDDENYFQLHEWNLWQIDEQPRHYVSTSRKSLLLCDVLNKRYPEIKSDCDNEVIEIKSDISEDNDVVVITNIETNNDNFFDDEEKINHVVENNNFVGTKERKNKEILDLILEDDPYHRMYSFEFPELPKREFFDQLIFTLPPKEKLIGLDLKEALHHFRNKTTSSSKMNRSRSPSPVFYSQSQLALRERETSTPTTQATKGKIIYWCS